MEGPPPFAPAAMSALLDATFVATRRAAIVVDNSRSVLKQDALSVVCEDPGVDSSLTGAVFRVEECTRWGEMTAAVTSMALAADRAGLTTDILLLNKAPGPLTVGNAGGSDDTAARVADFLATKPQGLTPLCAQLKVVAAQLLADASKNTFSSKSSLVVIFTDGESTDGDVMEVLLPLAALRVRLVIRLCTTEGEVVAYWRDIAAQLARAAATPGLVVTVVGTYVSVAADVARLNPWLTYGEALHRAREWGVAIPGADHVDARPLRPDEVRACVETLLGLRARPATTGSAADWRIFVASARSSLDSGNGLRWYCAARRRVLPCVDVDALEQKTPSDTPADEPPQTPSRAAVSSAVDTGAAHAIDDPAKAPAPSPAPAPAPAPAPITASTPAARAPLVTAAEPATLPPAATPAAPAAPATPATPMFATPLPYQTPAQQQPGTHQSQHSQRSQHSLPARDLLSPLTPGKMQVEMDHAELQALRQQVGRKEASDAAKGACTAP